MGGGGELGRFFCFGFVFGYGFKWNVVVIFLVFFVYTL